MIKPDFTITANSKDVSDMLMDKVSSIEVIEHSGHISDHCIITLDDHRNSRIQAPRESDVIRIALGYQQSELIDHGEYEIAEHVFSGARDTLTLYCNKLMWSGELKSPHHKSWTSTPQQPLSLGDLLNEIASNHNLEAKVNPELATITLPAIEQSESDLQLLTKLASTYDATARLVENYLVFMPRSSGLSRTGNPLESIELNHQQLINWQMLQSGMPAYQSCKAYYHDFTTAQRKMIEVGSGLPCYELPYPQVDEETATYAAKAKLNDFKRTQKTLKATAIGQAQLKAGGPIHLSGVRTDIDGDWVLTKVHHRIDSDGFISYLFGEKSTH